jgi:hypothetical protein
MSLHNTQSLVQKSNGVNMIKYRSIHSCIQRVHSRENEREMISSFFNYGIASIFSSQ